MKCYKCGSQLTDENMCLKCGADVTSYKTVVKASNAYYNLGLAKAQLRDLSGAVESLRTSLTINKNNIKARNLLGLIYCEMGDIVEALSEWVLSKNYKQEKNMANSYITNIQSNQGKFESVIQTIKKYNQSLKYAKGGNYDMAVIQLKKVITLNPKFIRAQQLLALLHIKDKDYGKAKKCLNNILKIDKNNTVAQRYLREIGLIEDDSAKDISESFLPRRKFKDLSSMSLRGNDVLLPPTSYKEPSNGAITVINILVGVLVGAALVWFLSIPARDKGLASDYNKSIIEYSEKLSSGNVELNSITKQLQDVQAERDALAKKIQDVSGTDGNNKLLIALIDSANSYIANEKTKAAEVLVNNITDVSLLPSDTAKALYNTIALATLQTAANDLYNLGTASYNKNNFTESADYFSRAYKLDSSKMDAAYYAAQSYVKLEQADNAKKYFQYIVTNFPTSKYVTEANTYISKH